MLLMIVNTVVFAADTTSTNALEKLLAPIRSITANFKQVTYGSRGKVMQTSMGKMAVARPDNFRWYTITPNKQLVVTNGKLLWVYDVDLEQASVRSLKKAQNNTPAMLLSGKIEDIEKYYQIKQTKQQGTQQSFVLTPKQKQGLFKQLQLNFNHQQIISMQFKDNLGQLVNITFSHVKTNPTIKASQFSFKPPPGVDVIGRKSP